MSFLTVSNGRIQTDDSSALGELEMGEIGKFGLFKKLKEFHKKHKKIHMKIGSYINPILIHKRHIEMIKKKLAKRKKHKKHKGGGGEPDQVTEESAAAPSTPEGVVPAALQPPTTTPFATTPGPMSPVSAPMAPFYPSPMQPPVEYPTSPQFPQAYPSGGGGGGGEQSYYAPQQRDSMPQFINTEEESRWQPPTPMYEGPSAYESDPGQRGTQVQQSQASPFDTSENEFASGPDTGDNFPAGSDLSGYLVSGGGSSWEDQGWGGMADATDDAALASVRQQAQFLRAQAQMFRVQGQEMAAQQMEQQARMLEESAAQEESASSTSDWLVWGGLAVAAFLIFSGEKKR